jgi:hypothetical protein
LNAVDPEITADELEAHLSDANTAKLLETVGMYAFAYEIVSSTVADNVSGFFTTGLDEKGWTFDGEWDEVRSKHRHELAACLDWLVDQDVLTEEEAASVDALRKERNRYAHNFTEILANPRAGFEIELLVKARLVLKKVAVFFGGIQADIDTALGSAEGEVDYEGIESGASLLYAHALRVWAGIPQETVDRKHAEAAEADPRT